MRRCFVPSRLRGKIRLEMSRAPTIEAIPQSAIPAAPLQNEDGHRVQSPELLAPAGDWDCVKAAVENGADAIYFGLDKFNARMRAQNFTEADLPKLMEFLHRRGVRGYVTLNTLVFENELADAENYLRAMIAAGVDAVIVQDAGICRLIRELSLDFPIHASTQMTITSAAGVEFARDLGCCLVVLARECSIAEIEKINSCGASVPASRTFEPARRLAGTLAPPCPSKFSSTARCASPIPANASPANPSAAVRRIAASARRRAGCLTI